MTRNATTMIRVRRARERLNRQHALAWLRVEVSRWRHGRRTRAELEADVQEAGLDPAAVTWAAIELGLHELDDGYEV